MIYTVRVWASLAVICLLLPLYANAARQQADARTLYNNAVAQEQQMLASKKLSSLIQNWKKVVASYQKVYYTYPVSGYCDNALFHIANLYLKMAQRFNDPLYYRRAASSFEFLIEQYPSSSLRAEAKVEHARILKEHVKQIPVSHALQPQTGFPASTQSLLDPIPLRPLSGVASMTKLRHYNGPDYSRVVIDFNREVTFKRNRLDNPDRLYFDFDETVATRSLLKEKFEVNDGFLKQIRIGQNTERRARVVLDLKDIEAYEVFPLYHPYRIVIDIHGKKGVVLPPLVDAAEAPAEMAKANTSGHYSLARQLGLKVRRIMIDPGHGGHDPGAMSGKLREKEITLDVSRRLKKLLEEEYDCEVLLTRDQDFYVPLEERIAAANSSGVDLFVSVHVNSSRNPRAKGIETYYLNFATTPEAMEVAARENAIAEKNMAELQKLTTAIALNSKIAESRDFATLIQTNLVGHLQKEFAPTSLGVKQAPFYVLIGAQMPAVLAEISFLSNRHENGLLARNSYRQTIAEGLARGVKGYMDTLADSKITQKRAR